MKNFKEEQPNWKTILCLYVVAIALGANLGVNSLLSKIMVEYPTIPATTIRLLSNIVTLTSTVISLIVGPYIGKKIGYKTITFIGLAFILVGGVMPALVNTFGLIFAGRVLYGLGFGLLTSRTGYAMLCAKKGTEAKISANLMLFYNLSGSAFSLLSGKIGDVNWRNYFLTFVVAVIPLVLSFMLLKEPTIVAVEEKKEDVSAVKAKLAPRTWMYAVTQFFISLTSVIWMVGSSQVLVEKGFTSVSQVSYIISAVSLGGIFSAFVFKFFNVSNPRLNVPLSTLSNSICCLCVVLSDSIVVLTIAGFIAGCGFILGLVSCTTYAGLSNDKSLTTTATIIVNSSNTCGVFLTGYYIAFCGKTFAFLQPKITYTVSTFAFSSALLLVLTIFTYVVNFEIKKPNNN